LPASVIVGYLAPLATAALGDPGADVASTAASAVGALAGALPWGPYRDLLHATLRKASAGRGGRDGRGYDVEGSKALHIRAAATILERFHEFDLDAETRAERETGAPAVATNVVGRLIHPSVVECLRLDVLPKLEALAVVEDNEGKGGTVRPAAAAATVAVLRLLPARDLEYDISRVLGKMANCLRSRAQGVRDSARAALASASAGLGAAHLPSVVSLLTTRLDRGFMVHVLGATLHSILDATIKTEHAEDVNPETDPEDVDDALEEIIPVLDADVFGRAAQEREEVAAIRGAYKEARRSRAHECLTLLAASASMPDALPKLLAPVTKRLHAASLPSLRLKIEAYAQAVAKGVLRNPRLSPEATLVLVYSVINDGVTRDERVAATESSMKLEETKLGEAKRGQKETGNRVWENGWCVLVSVWLCDVSNDASSVSGFGFRFSSKDGRKKVSAYSPYGSRSRCAIDVPTR
jgi:U3 small nucleolar RNA-associated protein 20